MAYVKETNNMLSLKITEVYGNLVQMCSRNTFQREGYINPH